MKTDHVKKQSQSHLAQNVCVFAQDFTFQFTFSFYLFNFYIHSSATHQPLITISLVSVQLKYAYVRRTFVLLILPGACGHRDFYVICYYYHYFFKKSNRRKIINLETQCFLLGLPVWLVNYGTNQPFPSLFVLILLHVKFLNWWCEKKQNNDDSITSRLHVWSLIYISIISHGKPTWKVVEQEPTGTCSALHEKDSSMYAFFSFFISLF